MRSPALAHTLISSHPCLRYHPTSSIEYLYPSNASPWSAEVSNPPMESKWSSWSLWEPRRTTRPPSRGPEGERLAIPWQSWRVLTKRGAWSMSTQISLLSPWAARERLVGRKIVQRGKVGQENVNEELTRPRSGGLYVCTSSRGIDGESRIHPVERDGQIISPPDFRERLPYLPADYTAMTYDQTEGGDPTYMPTFQTQSSWFTAYRLYSPPVNPYGRCWAVQVDRSSRLKSYGKDSSHCRADSRNDSQEDWGMREGNHAVAVTVEVGEPGRVSAGCRLSPEIKRKSAEMSPF